MTPARFEQVVVVPDSIRQAAGSAICSVPVVVVASTYELDVMVNVPVTFNVPVTGADGQVNPNRACRFS
jgi:hypothetical protein